MRVKMRAQKVARNVPHFVQFTVWRIEIHADLVLDLVQSRAFLARVSACHPRALRGGGLSTAVPTKRAAATAVHRPASAGSGAAGSSGPPALLARVAN